MIDSKYHSRALGAQIELCAARAATETSLRNARVLRAIAAALQLLLDSPDRQAFVTELRLRAVNSTYPRLDTSDADKAMYVVLGLTSHEAKQLATKTHGKKAWPL